MTPPLPDPSGKPGPEVAYTLKVSSAPIDPENPNLGSKAPGPRQPDIIVASPDPAMLDGALTEPGLALLFAVAGTALGAYQSIFNMIPYRLTGAPYNLATWMVSLIFLVNLFGSFSASVSGTLAARLGRRTVAPLGGVILLAGALLTLAQPLWAVFAGLIVFTVGFFAVHSVAAGWVTARAVSGVGAPGQASSAYSIMYYAGGSFFGTIAGFGWGALGWKGVVLVAGILALAVIALTLILRKVKPLTSSGY